MLSGGGGVCDVLALHLAVDIFAMLVTNLNEIDHNDPSKPSHRLTNGPKPSKTIESEGSNIKKPW